MQCTACAVRCTPCARSVQDWHSIGGPIGCPVSWALYLQSSSNRENISSDWYRIEARLNALGISTKNPETLPPTCAVRCTLRTGLAHDWHSIGGPIGCPVSWALYLQSSSNRENISSDWYRIEARLYVGFEVHRCAHFTLHWIAA